VHVSWGLHERGGDYRASRVRGASSSSAAVCPRSAARPTGRPCVAALRARTRALRAGPCPRPSCVTPPRHHTPAHTPLAATRRQALRLANNSLTGSVPATAAKAPRLLMLDLSSNKLQGRLPEDWESPALQMLLLEDNKLTGGWACARGARLPGGWWASRDRACDTRITTCCTRPHSQLCRPPLHTHTHTHTGSVPASLAALHNLGVLRLASNHLSGDLTAFAAALPDPQQVWRTQPRLLLVLCLHVCVAACRTRGTARAVCVVACRMRGASRAAANLAQIDTETCC
jgi:hypothetical protein